MLIDRRWKKGYGENEGRDFSACVGEGRDRAASLRAVSTHSQF